MAIRDLMNLNASTAQARMYTAIPYERKAEISCSWNCYEMLSGNRIRGISCDHAGKATSYDATFAESHSPVHKHDFIEIAYVVEGELIQWFANKTVTFQAGDLFLIGRGVEHCELTPARPSLYFFLTMPTDMFSTTFVHQFPSQILIQFIREALVTKSPENGYLAFHPLDDGAVDEILYAIAMEVHTHADGYFYFLQGWFIRMIDELNRNYEPVLSRGARQKMRELIYYKVDSYMRENAATVTVEALCDKFHYNSCYFNKLIHDFTGESYVSHLQRIRLEQARMLLRTTELSVKDIAEQVGYRNLTFFYRIFKENTGHSPSAYRTIGVAKL